MMIDRLETRLQYASISGTLWNDADSSQTFDRNETARPGVTVFVDTNKNGSLDVGEPTSVTDSKGRYGFTNLTSGTYTIGTVTDSEELLSTNVGPGGTTQGRFNISFVGLRGATPGVKGAFQAAARRWESIIGGDLPDVTLSDGTKIDDLQITANVGPIDGAGSGSGNTLGITSVTAVRKGSSLPYQADMTFDEYDLASLQAEGSLYDVILHEMGHALGFGSVWDQTGVLQGSGSRNPRFVGANAVRAYNTIYHANNLSIPIENDFGGGTRNSHWKETVLNEELMTGFTGGDVDGDGFPDQTDANGNPLLLPLSNITVGSMADIGYAVDLNSGDPWNPVTHVSTPKTAVMLGGVAEERQVRVFRNDKASGLDFGYRDVEAPTIGKLSIAPSPTAVNKDITIAASKLVDKNGTGIRDVSFYRETNGTAGLQRNEDTLVGTAVASDNGVWRTTFNTQGLAGTQTFYAVVTDKSGYVGRRTGEVEVRNIIPPQFSPQDVGIRVRNSSSVRFTFTDASADVDNYRIEVSTSRNFGDSVVQVINLASDTKITTITGLTAGTTYYVRVRGNNTAGNSPYSTAVSFETR